MLNVIYLVHLFSKHISQTRHIENMQEGTHDFYSNSVLTSTSANTQLFEYLVFTKGGFK